jgi:hypothetical protein
MGSNQLNSPKSFGEEQGQYTQKKAEPIKITPDFSRLENPATLIKHIEGLAEERADQFSTNLKTVLATRQKLRELKASEIRFSEPVLKQGDNSVIFPHTINVIQGQAGVHKSRLAENICAAFLRRPGCENELLGFRRLAYDTSHTVVYVDTERNLSEQLPYALQSIQIHAGYKREDHPANFEYCSLLKVNRKDRFRALSEFLTHIRQTVQTPLFVVLDVSTDCIEDFNKTDKSMELIDLMNMAINEHNVIFLCLIHENPKSDKARGHFGTELMNKASAVMQVGFEKDDSQNDTDLIRVKYLKCRSTARHTPFYIKYSNEIKGLVLADANAVAEVVNNRKRKAGNEDMLEHLEMFLGDGSTLSRVELIEKLCIGLGTSDRTIEKRLLEIVESGTIMTNDEGLECKLTKKKDNKTLYYQLVSITPF